jgi:hypothetical protein
MIKGLGADVGFQPFYLGILVELRGFEPLTPSMRTFIRFVVSRGASHNWLDVGRPFQRSLGLKLSLSHETSK